MHTMIRPRYLPPDSCFDDPAANLDPPDSTVHTLAFAMAGDALRRIGEWTTRGRKTAKSRALRSDVVWLCFCPQFLDKRASAAWVARQHNVSRQRVSLLQQEFARELGPYIQFNGQRFLNQANGPQVPRSLKDEPVLWKTS